jgi:hypothetical protein
MHNAFLSSFIPSKAAMTQTGLSARDVRMLGSALLRGIHGVALRDDPETRSAWEGRNIDEPNVVPCFPELTLELLPGGGEHRSRAHAPRQPRRQDARNCSPVHATCPAGARRPDCARRPERGLSPDGMRLNREPARDTSPLAARRRTQTVREPVGGAERRAQAAEPSDTPGTQDDHGGGRRQRPGRVRPRNRDRGMHRAASRCNAGLRDPSHSWYALRAAPGKGRSRRRASDRLGAAAGSVVLMVGRTRTEP